MKKLTRILAMATFMFAGLAMFNSCNDDPCKDVSCLNGGTCDNGSCLCAAGFEGADCSVLENAKFVGTFAGTESCTAGTDTYSMVITASTTNLQTVTISNIYNAGYIATATVSGSAITLPSTTVTAGVTASGSGTVTGTNLSFTYTVSDGTTTNTCTFSGVKQ